MPKNIPTPFIPRPKAGETVKEGNFLRETRKKFPSFTSPLPRILGKGQGDGVFFGLKNLEC